MATIKSHTDLSQSKTLSKILPHETADMWFVNGIIVARDSVNEPDDIKSVFPCWSLAALLSVLPHIQEFYPIISKINDKYVCRYKDSGIWTNGDNPIDACVEMILKLNELKLL